MIRKATLVDVPAMLDLGAAMHAESRYARLPWNRAKVKRLIEWLIFDANGCAMVVSRNGEIIGGFLGMCYPHYFSDELVAVDLTLFVRPDRRGGLAAAQLLKGFVAWAKKRGAAMIQAGVTTGVTVEKTSRLYAAVDFVQVGNLFEFQGETHVHGD